MKIFKIILAGLLFISILIAMLGLIYLANTAVDNSKPRMYNCSIAEISPDFTTAMREECRQQRKVSI